MEKEKGKGSQAFGIAADWGVGTVMGKQEFEAPELML